MAAMAYASPFLGVVGAIKAYRGEPWSIPVLGPLSRWILGTPER